MFNFNRDDAARERQQKVDALPKLLKTWRQELIARHLPAVKAAAADRDKAVAELQREMAPHAAARDKAQQELTAARAYVANVPIDAAVEQVATQAVIADQWPARVAAYNVRVADVQARINAAEEAYNAAERHAQAELDLELRDGIQAMQEARPLLIRELE